MTTREEGKDEPRYDLVLSLIEKYLKEKSSEKLQKLSGQNPDSVPRGSACKKETELNGSEGVSIDYPGSGSYPDKENCLWRISVPSNQSIELTVRRLSIEATEGCRWDRLEIFDGGSAEDKGRLLTSLCGFILPSASFVSISSQAVVRFASDDTVGYGGFRIDVRPVPRPRRVAEQLQQQDKSSQELLTLKKAPKNSAECPNIKELKEPSGIIKFPMAGDYNDNLSCKWRIVATAGQVIQLQVTSIDIEAPVECHNCCWFDWLSLYDGRTENASSLLAKLCGTMAPSTPFTTTSSAALVVFRSNARNGDEGFQLNYRIVLKDKAKSGLGVCAGQVVEVRKPSGVLQSPGFDQGKFPENAKCRWRIVASPGQVIQVKFDVLNIENDVACVYDSLSFYDGYNRSAPFLGSYCGEKLPPDLVSSGPNLLVSFESDDSMSDGQFSISWTFLDMTASVRKDTEGCEGQTDVLQQNEGAITSPNYGEGRQYPNAARCSWRIVVSASMRVLLRFEKFNLEPPLFDTECYDALSVYDGPYQTSPLLGSYCGVYAPSDLLSSGNQVYLSFASDKGTRAAGFLIRYTAKNATGNIFGSECGVPDIMPKIYSRIVGGVEATPHSWPWQVSMKYSGYNWQHWCGASVLYPHWVITAAHCVHGYGPASNFKIVLGEHDRLEDEGMEEELEVKEIIIHDDFDSGTNDNDIALFRLPEDVRFNRYIKPICLPNVDVEENVLCIATGWGDTRSTGKETVLNQVYVPVISRIQCNQPNWYGGQVTDNMICAGFPEGRKDACQGDSGGPLVCLSEGRWKLFGVTSFGLDCALSHHPGIYTRVTRYLEWIQEKTGQ